MQCSTLSCHNRNLGSTCSSALHRPSTENGAHGLSLPHLAFSRLTGMFPFMARHSRASSCSNLPCLWSKAMLSTASQGSWAALLVLVLSRDENNLIIQNQKEKKKKITKLPHCSYLFCSSCGLYKQEKINMEYKRAKPIIVAHTFQTSTI